jgi:hypothetical protein
MRLVQKNKINRKNLELIRELNAEIAAEIKRRGLQKQRPFIALLLEGILLQQKQRERVQHPPKCLDYGINNQECRLCDGWDHHSTCPVIEYRRQTRENTTAIQKNINCLKKAKLMVFEERIGYLYRDYDCECYTQDGSLL